MAYKGSGKKAKIQGSGRKRSSFLNEAAKALTPKVTRKAQGHDSRKVHDTQRKNTHGRTKW